MMGILAQSLKPAPSSLSIEDIFNHVVLPIVEIERDIQVILFGSHARKTASENSDIDLAIITRKRGDELKLFKKRVYALDKLKSFAIDFLFFSEDEYIRKKNIGGVSMLIDLEGVVVYDKISKV